MFCVKKPIILVELLLEFRIVVVIQDSDGKRTVCKGVTNMASDWVQKRLSHFVSSELLNPVENCSSRRRVTLFVSSCFSFRQNSA